MSVPGVSELRWKGQREIKNDDYTVHYSGCERAERGLALVVHRNTMRSAVTKIVCNDRIIGLKLQEQPVTIFLAQVYMPISVNGVDEAEGLEKILEEDGKGETRTLQNKSKRATDRIRNNILRAYVER